MALNKYLDDRGLGTLIHEIRRSMVVAYKIRGSAIYADAAYVAHAQNQDLGYWSDIDSVGIWQRINGVWTKLTTFEQGWVFNIANEFHTANDDFVEGNDVWVPAGTNIVVAEITSSNNMPVYKWDLLGKTVDTSIYQTKRLVRPLNLFTNEISPAYATHNLLPSQEAKASNMQVTEGMIAIMTDASEYGDVYRAHLTTASDPAMWDITWTKLGNQTTVEGALELMESLLPNTVITDQEIITMFNA